MLPSAAFLAALTFAQPRDDELRVRVGDDLVAWQAMNLDDAQALREFIEQYPTSPLTERAYRELREMGQAQDSLPPVAQSRLETSVARHDLALERSPTAVSVATLPVGTSASTDPVSSRLYRPSLAMGWMGQSVGGSLSTELALSRRHLGVHARIDAARGAERDLSASVALRGTLWLNELSPYGELGLHTALRRPSLALGVVHPLDGGFALNMGAEVLLGNDAPTPSLRVSLRRSF